MSNNIKYTWRKDITFLLLGLAIFYLAFLGGHSLVNPDESRYSEVAREMLTSGDFITPKVNGAVFFDKPILYYWLQASSIELFGVNETAIRLWPSLFGILGCLFIYIAGRNLYDRRTGLIAAITLACSPLYYLAAHYANMDLEVAVLISCSLLAFLVAVQPKNQLNRQKWLYLSYIFAGLAILTKGLIGLMFPLMIIGTWILLTNQWHIIKNMSIFTGLLIILAITAPWFILVQQHNPDFFHFFFYIQHFQRFISENFNSKSSLWFYLPVILLGIFPWTFFFFSALAKTIKALWKNRKGVQTELFLLLWAILIFIFFSIPTSKLIGYIIPVLPPIILLTSHYISQLISNLKQNNITMLFISLAIFLTALICLATPYLPQYKNYLTSKTPSLIMASVLFISSIILFLSIRKKFFIAFVATTFVAVSSLMTLMLITPYIGIPTNKPLVQAMQRYYQPGDLIVNYKHYFYDVPIYSQNTVVLVEEWNSPKINKKDNWRRLFSYALQHQPELKNRLITPHLLWQKWQQDQRIFLYTRKAHYKQIVKMTGNKAYIIASGPHFMLISNKLIINETIH